MDSKILSTLVELGHVNTSTRVKAYTRTLTFSGTKQELPKIVNWSPNIHADKIIDIEGMDPVRYAASHDIKPNGEMRVYKKRGRKPKVVDK